MSTGDASNSLKVILVGSSGVGKTSLVSAYFDNPFENQELPTVAPASCTATVTLDNARKVDLQIWDTAGQERFQSISQMFYRDSHVAFVCYDIENTESIDQWVERVRQSVPECVIFLVTTKADLLTTDQQTECADKGNAAAKRLNCKLHLLTSAQNGLGVKELFMNAAQTINNINPQHTENAVDLKKDQKKPDKKDKCC
ncbi:small GTP-binding protein [Tritrichomonas foetus]|uniref:Small GTP-binding protein n=1 Tax=Tritrichomonas foetus TaxID=1144522 RepID=A0A1J4JMN6_9EUKA|nr:small GTP-binding protein [Tritrichomonas foetus]|eukprot:OHS99961.1 small GTP-binding protein [Tritrichomonas foetus]